MISYAITVCNESVELRRLLDHLLKNILPTDEIVVQMDAGNTTQDVRDVLSDIMFNVNDRVVALKICAMPLNRDFGAFKNNLNAHCKGDWIFNIDADEIPNEDLLTNMHSILDANSNPDIGVIYIPRWNTVDGITPEHVSKWGWNLDTKDRINWPDYQLRLYRNSREIYWKGKVHEVITGYKAYGTLPPEKSYALMHHKSIAKQEIQNSLYATL